MFVRLRERAGVRNPPQARWQPRLQDLRHSFATHRLIAWYREGVDLQNRLLALSVYLGHASPASTQAYLSMTPELLAEALAALRALCRTWCGRRNAMTDTHPIAPFVRRFLTEELMVNRGLSPNTQKSYRDTIRLLFRFLAERRSTEPTQVTVEQVDDTLVRNFLRDLRERRGNSVATAQSAPGRLAFPVPFHCASRSGTRGTTLPGSRPSPT